MTIGNGKKLSILHVGTKSCVSPLKSFQLQKVFHVPHLATNLISVSKLYINNNSFVEFLSRFFLIKDLVIRKALLWGKLENDLYKFPTNLTVQTSGVLAFFSSSHNVSTTRNLNNMFNLYHLDLGHLITNILKKMLLSCNISFQCYKHTICCPC